jgi:hypothetical protein
MYEIIKLLKCAPNFSLREWKRNEKKEAEEYCWAITQAAGRPYRGRSGSSVLGFGFQLDSIVFTYLYIYIYIYMCVCVCVYVYVPSIPTWRKIRFPERNYKRKSGSVCTFNIILHLKTRFS